MNIHSIIVPVVSILWPVSVYFYRSQYTVTGVSILWPVSGYCDRCQYTLACDSILWPVSVYFYRSQYTVTGVSVLWPVSVYCDRRQYTLAGVRWQYTVTAVSTIWPVSVYCDRCKLTVTGVRILWPAAVYWQEINVKAVCYINRLKHITFLSSINHWESDSRKIWHLYNILYLKLFVYYSSILTGIIIKLKKKPH